MHSDKYMEIVDMTIKDIFDNHVVDGMLEARALAPLHSALKVKHMMMKMHSSPKTSDAVYR